MVAEGLKNFLQVFAITEKSFTFLANRHRIDVEICLL